MNAAMLAGKRVLLAEDELMVAMLIEDVLAHLRCQVFGPFATLESALAAARDTAVAIDIALLDVNLRGQKIYPVAEVLVARGIPFLLVSGYGRQAIPLDRPDWRVCAKPFTSRELVAMMMERFQAGGYSAVT